ncbi:ATPase family AAA domain-containing protein 1-B-like isoform X1 [Limulus polyphemus]|uniref:ATPase family AAA domain-containing protein 1-B-like isoform X1 n=1 Tax=Limulus polyphemus TaxID=6850 RepID=A0ABM1SWH3_LIMPO|nr:ATPase family AAA domain-containing protein 1-B-like isoform X1 [Limulus polyphemus]
MAGGKVHFTSQLTRNEIIGLVFRLTLFGALTYFGVKWMVNAIDPTRKQKVEAQKRAERILSRIGVSNIKLTEYELSIAAQLVDPESIGISWSDIAGLDDIIQEIRETVILPIQKRELFQGSSLIQPPKDSSSISLSCILDKILQTGMWTNLICIFISHYPIMLLFHLLRDFDSLQSLFFILQTLFENGVLLHGPPGCGKTMIAKATAKEAGARFINLEVSSLTDKWYGESQKLAAAVFSLAVKIQPCIIFVDEIDSFLRSRDTHDHEATAMMKAQFMSLWDGLITDPKCQVIIMGATNRPQDVDRAILRRMPAMFNVGLPNLPQREGILNLILVNEMVCEDVSVSDVAKMTGGFSGSDLRELCRIAALYRVRDYLKEEAKQKEVRECKDEENYYDALRPISMEDFICALEKMKYSKVHSLSAIQSIPVD